MSNTGVRPSPLDQYENSAKSENFVFKYFLNFSGSVVSFTSNKTPVGW
ncbi:Uncharacterised protein, partial [Mycoplasmopsis synoviae]